MLFSKKFTPKLFSNPTSEYRGAPFWSWNTKLEKEELLWQIEELKKMGFGGFHIHPRIGLETPYLSDEFMALVKSSTEKAETEGLLCWLYDEDRWPSGFAGGLVTQEEKYRARHLLFTPISYESSNGADTSLACNAEARRNNSGKLLARYEISLKGSKINSFSLLKEGEQCSKGGVEWFAYLEVASSDPWFNNQTYANTLDKSAIERFVQVTHERYKEVIGNKFGKVVPAIFTDEPQFTRKSSLLFAKDQTDLFLPFTDDFEERFIESYGESFLAKLPLIFWDNTKNTHQLHRYRFHDFVSELFASNFADVIGSWCRENNIALTGHMMEEPTLESQTRAIGDCMRSYRAFDLPGIDMLCDNREYSTVKQAQSVAHQKGAPGLMSELYGVTNWDFDFRGHKLQGDWQAALGVCLRVHHLCWVSMAGAAKRDYPATISYQVPWYKEYTYVEDHFARVNTAMTQGKPKVEIGVIHPIESYWLEMGSQETSGEIRSLREENFQNLIDWLLHAHLDFDFISESLIPTQVRYEKEGTPSVGEMQYKALLVPSCKTIRSSTLEFLKESKKAGCKIIFSGEIPEMVDALPSQLVKEFAQETIRVSHSSVPIKHALEETRQVSIQGENSLESNRHIYQLREDGQLSWLFIANSRAEMDKDTAWSEKLKIAVLGYWVPELLNTHTGEILRVEALYEDGKTWLEAEVYEHDSLLYRLTKGKSEIQKGSKKVPEPIQDRIIGVGPDASQSLPLDQRINYSLSEKNVLVLDYAKVSLDNVVVSEGEEILRANEQIRRILEWPATDATSCQPWALNQTNTEYHLVTLEFIIDSEINLSHLSLALERASQCKILWNGKQVSPQVEGWYTDKHINTIALTKLRKGENQLKIQVPYTALHTLEACYLLGDFGVTLQGSYTRIIEKPEKISFGDWTSQGFPFYGGNLSYQIPVTLEPGLYQLETPQYRCPLLSVRVDGKDAGKIAYAPYQLEFEITEGGMHIIELTAYGSRVNTFGALHNADPNYLWYGPSSWATKGRSWSYEYQIKKAGLLIGPRLFKVDL